MLIILRRHREALIIVFITALFINTFTYTSDTAALKCSNYDVIGIRGSGQTFLASDELNQLKNSLVGSRGVRFEELTNRIPSLSYLEEYPAVPVIGLSVRLK